MPSMMRDKMFMTRIFDKGNIYTLYTVHQYKKQNITSYKIRYINNKNLQIILTEIDKI